MDKEKQKDFARRISQANKTELVVITYDIILEEIETARNFRSAENLDEYRHAMKQAQRFLAELMSVLDFKYGLSLQLMSLYEYVQRILIKCDITAECSGLESAENVLKGLRSSFDKISSEDHSGSVMMNSQSVFAGLTYGKGSLNEYNPSEGSNRGFLA